MLQKYNYKEILQWHVNKLDSLEEIDTFLETCNLPTLNQEERENLTDPELLKKIESVIKKKNPSQQTKASDLRVHR